MVNAGPPFRVQLFRRIRFDDVRFGIVRCETMCGFKIKLIEQTGYNFNRNNCSAAMRKSTEYSCRDYNLIRG